MELRGEPVVSKGVVERRFDVKSGEAIVPTIVWTPEGATGDRPLMVMGHGMTGNKRNEPILALARRFVRHHGFAVASIDAIGHGERDDTSAPPFHEGSDAMREWLGNQLGEVAIERMRADWRATVDSVRALPEVGEGPLGYWGLSMGTIFGLPFVAGNDEVRVAVLGLMGTYGAFGKRLATDAPRVACPVLYLLQTDDELAPFDRGINLFLLIGTRDKRLHVNTGLHAAVPREEGEAMEEFLARHLGAAER